MTVIPTLGTKLRSLCRWLSQRPVIELPVLAFVITFVLEVLSRRGIAGVFEFIAASPLMFAFNALIVLLTLVVCQLAKRRRFALCAVCALWLILGFINFLVLSYRTTPLGMIDLLLATTAVRMINVYLSPFEIILIICGCAALIVGGVLLWRRSPKQRVRPVRAILSAAMVGAVVWGFSACVTPAEAVSESFGNLASAYDDLGFAYCFSTSVIDRGVEKPEDYSAHSVSGVCQELETDVLGARPNVIFLQLESFFDPASYAGVSLEENPIPNFTRLRSEFSTGRLSMPSVGAGTANSEFEVLTGMNMEHFGAGEYPYKTILGSSTCESLAYNFSKIGYRSTAIHNHIRSFYGREGVFENMGFDEFISVEDMEPVERTPTGWAKDGVLAQEILDVLSDGGECDFIYAITVQAHGKYTDIDDEDETNLPEGGQESIEAAWAYYAEQLSGTDAFVGELIAALENCGEPSVVVMFGDHLPSLEIDETQLAGGDQFCTEYVIWSNFGLGKRDADLEAYQLGAYLQQRLGLCVGTVTAIHQQYGWNKQDEVYQHALQTVEYDMLYGEKYVFDGEEGYAPTSLSRNDQ